jgi:hypothetical protein
MWFLLPELPLTDFLGPIRGWDQNQLIKGVDWQSFQAMGTKIKFGQFF